MTTTGVVTPVLAPGMLVGEYEIAGVLGKGGMGTVYAGVHPKIGKKVAIKVLNSDIAGDPDAIARFVQEARAVNQIGHRNIVDIFAFGDLPGGAGHYFVMERLDGESLQTRMKRQGRLSPKETLDILEQTADAIDRAHSMGIYHRDLKPDNLFLVPNRERFDVKVLDFGIAKLTDSAEVRTHTGVPMGTPLFMSPEQWRGRGVDHRTDIYALGVMAYHMLTGRYPFEADSFPSLMYLHLEEPAPAPSLLGAPRWANEAIAQALSKQKEARPASAGAFCAALRRAMEPGAVALDATAPRLAPVESQQSVDPTRPKMLDSKTGDYYVGPSGSVAPARRRRLLAGGVGALVAVAAGVILVVSQGGPKDAAPSSPGSPPAAGATPALEVVDAALARPIDAGSAAATVWIPDAAAVVVPSGERDKAGRRRRGKPDAGPGAKEQPPDPQDEQPADPDKVKF